MRGIEAGLERRGIGVGIGAGIGDDAGEQRRRHRTRRGNRRALDGELIGRRLLRLRRTVRPLSGVPFSPPRRCGRAPCCCACYRVQPSAALWPHALDPV